MGYVIGFLLIGIVVSIIGFLIFRSYKRDEANQLRKSNYAVMIPLALFACSGTSLIGLVSANKPQFNFIYMACIMPTIALIGSAIGWAFGALISKTPINPLHNVTLFMSYLGFVFGMGIGTWVFFNFGTGETFFPQGTIELVFCWFSPVLGVTAIGYVLGKYAKRTRDVAVD